MRHGRKLPRVLVAKRVAGLASILLAGWLTVSVQGQSEPNGSARKYNDSGVKAGDLVKGSISPDGKYALFEYHPVDSGLETTESAIALAPADRSRWLLDIDSVTKWMTDKDVPSFLSFRWNSKSTLLATHDATRLHSTARIYRVQEGKAALLEIPDLLAAACQKLGIKRPQVSASGQIPGEWNADDVLVVTVRLTVGSRKTSEKLRLKVADDGTVTVI